MKYACHCSHCEPINRAMDLKIARQDAEDRKKYPPIDPDVDNYEHGDRPYHPSIQGFNRSFPA